MSSYGDRKRKAASVSKDETDTSPRLTKHLKAPPRTTTSNEGASEQGPPGLLDLPAGVVAKVAQSIDIMAANDEKIFEGQRALMALCVVFGSKVARVIRREYLRGNLVYLNYWWRVYRQCVGTKGADGPERKKGFVTIPLFFKVALEQWMEENDWWKDACKDAILFAAQGEEISNNYPTICKTVACQGFEDNLLKGKVEDDEDEDEMVLPDIIQFGACAKVDLISHSERGELEQDHTIVLAVNGIDLKSLTLLDEIEELLVKEGRGTLRVIFNPSTLRVISNDFANIFFNPALTIDLGLFDLLKFQIEYLKLSVNCGAYIGATFGSKMFPLIVHALVNPDARFLKYVLSIEGVEANPILQHTLRGRSLYGFNNTLLHECSDFVRLGALPTNVSLSRIEMVLLSKDIDVNVENEEGLTPLGVLCLDKCAENTSDKGDVGLAKLSLSRGAKLSEDDFDDFWEGDLYNLLKGALVAKKGT